MKDIDDLFLKDHYSDLTPIEQTLIEDLCSDEVSFQQVKALVTQSMDVLPVSPPAHLLEALNQTFDQTYSKPSSKGMRPRMFNLFIASAAAASLLILFTTYLFKTTSAPEEQTARVKKRIERTKQNPALNKQLAKKTTAPNQPLVAELPQVIHSDPPPSDDGIITPSDEPLDLAAEPQEEAKSLEIRGSRSDNTVLPGEATNVSQANSSNTYQWTAVDKNIESSSVVIANVPSRKKSNLEPKRLNTSLLLKQIKPVY
jgi:hypothetical protein